MDPTSGTNSASDSDATREGNPPASESSLSNLFAKLLSSLGSSSRPKTTGPDPGEVTPEMTQAAARVRELYASGVPFFTKHALAELNVQLARARKRYVRDEAPESKADDVLFLLKPLEGRTLGIRNAIGSVSQMDDVLELVVVDHNIKYNTYQRLIALNKSPGQYCFDTAYCPLRIGCSVRQRDKTTKQFLPYQTVGPQTPGTIHTQEAFDAGVKAWEVGDECGRLVAALMATALPEKTTKVVAFACSSLSMPIDSERCIAQHALILTIKNILQQKSPTVGVDIRCYAQDPAYTDQDRAILERAGIHVVEDPQGFLEVDESTVVISICPEVPVRQIVADIARPAIMVWNKVRSEEEMLKLRPRTIPDYNFNSVEELAARHCDPESSRVREMIDDEYVEIQELSEDTFRAYSGNPCVYVRKC